MQRFAFKPALLRARLCYAVGPQALECQGTDGDVLWRLGWAEIRAAAYVEHAARGVYLRRLDLVTANERRSVSCTGDGDPATDADAATHLALVVAILDRLAHCDEDLEVRLGEHGKTRLALFAIGLMTVIGSFVIAAMALLSGLASDRLGAAAVPVLLLFAGGVALVLANAPWHRPPSLKAARLAQALREVAVVRQAEGRAGTR